MTGIKEAGGEIGSGLFLGLGALGLFLMLGLCSTGINKPIVKTDFQYCYGIDRISEEQTNKDKEYCFQKLKELK